MEKLNIQQLEAIRGGSGTRLRTCFLAGIFTAIGVGIGIGSGNLWGGGAAFIAGVSAANYKGCL
jgi:hypothetical protein